MLTLVWSPFKGQSGTTTALCALGYYISRSSKSGERTLLMRTKLKRSGIVEVMDSAKYGLSTSVHRKSFQMNFEEATGDRNIDHLLMAYAAGFQLLDTLEANVLQLDTGLCVLEGSRSNSREIYEKEIYSTISKILKVACHSFENVLVEAEAGLSAVNSILFELADKIIVCIPQNIFALRELIDMPLPTEKVSFLIGNYDEKSVLSAKNLSKQLKTDNTVKGFPYQSNLRNAYSDGKLKRELELIFSDEQDELGPRLQEVLA